MAFNLFDTPDYYSGLLGEQGVQDLQKKAMTTGLINAALGFIAQPRNQRYGSALPYLGKALAAGYQSGQDVIAGGLRDYETQQKIAEMQRKKEQQAALQEMINSIEDPNQRRLALLNPDEWAKSQLQKPKKQIEKVGRQLIDVTEGTPQVLFTGEPEEKAMASTTLNKLITERNTLASANPNDPNIKLYDDAIRKETTKSEGININYGAPVAGVDAQGNPVFFQPSKTGGAPTIVSGVSPLREEKPATESQAKAGAFANQMSSASKEFGRLQGEGYDPTSFASQAATSVAGTPLTVLADPKAQQANQAQQQWAEAYLRFKTGAAATESEVKRNMRTFFPQFGDSAQVIAQKARMRKEAENDVRGAGKQPSTIKSPATQQQRSREDILKQYGL